MRDLAGKTVLVTGASGFIGRAVSRRLQAAGARVSCVSRRAEPEPGPWDRWWQVDLANIADVRRLFAGAKPDLVFHLAGITSATRGIESVLPILHANLVPAVNLLVAAGEYPVERLVLTGSLEEPEPDGTWPVASSPYAASKFGAGVYMRMCHALYATPAVWLRLFMVYGPAQADVRKLIPYVTRALLRGEAPALSDGKRAIDWIYIDDVAEAFLAAGLQEGVEGHTIDIGSGQLVTVREVVERLVQTVNPALQPQFGSVPERRLEQMRVADVQRTAERLGWRATTSLGEGLRQTVDWYRHEVVPAAAAPAPQAIGA
jgi:nucleoside-diphosphate-sugar epimerase